LDEDREGRSRAAGNVERDRVGRRAEAGAVAWIRLADRRGYRQVGHAGIDRGDDGRVGAEIARGYGKGGDAVLRNLGDAVVGQCRGKRDDVEFTGGTPDYLQSDRASDATIVKVHRHAQGAKGGPKIRPSASRRVAGPPSR